jgi:sulfofructose kinase
MQTRLDQAHFDIEWPPDRPFQLIGFGLNAVDWVCQVPEYPPHNSKVQMDALWKMGGGQIATAAALCARYGLKARYVGRVGDDDIGQFSLADLAKEPMDLQVEIVPNAFSQFSVIILDRQTGERTIIWDRDPKLHYLDGELDRSLIVQGQLLHLDGHDQPASITAARWAKEAGMKVSIDIDKAQPGVEELLGLVDFVLPSQHFAEEFAGTSDWRRALRAVASASPGFTGVTRGSAGCAVWWEDDIVEIPGIEIEPVDTTGAGDVFHGAFVYAIFQNWTIRRCLEFANVAAALSCARLGARGGIPALEEILARLP